MIHHPHHKIEDKDLNIGIDIDAIVRNSSPKRNRSHNVIVRLENVSKNFKTGTGFVHALRDVNIHLYSGEFAIVYGPSGCGKSTLLHTILGLEHPTHGKVYIRDHLFYHMSDDDRAKLRRQYFGMVFQQSHWVKALNVWENVAYSLYLMGMKENEAKPHAFNSLDRLGISNLAYRSPLQLSGGQQQKVALARALVTNPWVIIADEPTGNLDSQSGREMMELFVKLNRDEHRMVLLVTHDLSLLTLATRRIGLKDGVVLFDEHENVS